MVKLHPRQNQQPVPNWLGVEEAPKIDQTRIIGVELTLENRGERAELEMIAVKHTIPFDYHGQTHLLVTIHTTRGDRQARIQL